MSKEGSWGQLLWDGVPQARLVSRIVILLSSKFCSSRTASCIANPAIKSKMNCPWVSRRSEPGACFAGKPCWRSWRAAPKRVVLIRPSRLMTASSVGESTIEGTLFRVSGCLAVLNGGPAGCFLFPYRTEPPTHWRPSYLIRLNPARWSSVIAGVRIAISTCWVTHSALSSTAYTSCILTPRTTPIQPSRCGIESRSSWGHTTGEDYHYHPTHYMFAARCKAHGIPPFIQFLHLNANTDWSNVRYPPSSTLPHAASAMVPLCKQACPCTILIIFRLVWS